MIFLIATCNLHNETVITFFTPIVSKNDDRLNTLRYSIFNPLRFSNRVIWLYFIFINRNLWFYIPDKIISILCILFFWNFLFRFLRLILFPAHKRLIYVYLFDYLESSIGSEIGLSEVRFPYYCLKIFGGYTFFCFLNDSGLNFLNSKPFVISVLYDLLIQIDLLGFSPLQPF